MESKKATEILSDFMQKLSSIGKAKEEVKEEVVELSKEVTETEVIEEEAIEATSTETEIEGEVELKEEKVEDVSLELSEEKEETEKYVSRLDFEEAISEIKQLFSEVTKSYEKEKVEMSAQIEDLSKQHASEPLSHSPEAEISNEKKVLFSQKRGGSTMDRVLSKMYNK